MKHLFILFFSVIFSLSGQAQKAQQGEEESTRIDFKKIKGKDDPQARLEFLRLQTMDPATGEIPENIRQKELEFYNEQSFRALSRARTDAASTPWVQRGPKNVGGRTRALAVDQRNENIILAGGVSGGMWRSIDQGATWSKRTLSNDLQSVSCIAQDPSNQDVWYYGTGELSGNSAGGPGAPYRGDGIFKSTDNGVSWSLLPATSTERPQSLDNIFDYVSEIEVTTAGVVVATTLYGVYLSTDGGASFSESLSNNDQGDWVDVVLDQNDVAYAALDNLGIFRSTDLSNWTNITPTGFSLRSGDRIELAVAPSNVNVLYALREDGGVWKYDHSEELWENRSASVPSFGGQGNWNPQGGYNLLITVKPDNEDFVIIGGTNLYRSTDGFSNSVNTSWVGGYGATSFVYRNHHPDQHSFVWLANNTSVISGCDGGVRMSTDITRNTADNVDPVIWSSLNNGYITTQSYAVSVGPGDQIMSGFQDNSTWLTTTSDGDVDWTDQFGGDGAYSAFNSDGTQRFLSSQRANIFRISYPDADSQSPTNFVSFTPSGFPGNLFINPFYVDPVNDEVFYLPGDVKLWVNTQANSGSSGIGWKTIEIPGIAAGSITTELGVSRNNTVYVGTTSGQLFKVENPSNEAVVTNVTDQLFPNGYVSGVAVNPLNANEVLISFSNYNIQSLFYSADGGATWSDVGGNLEENTNGTGNGPSISAVQIVGDHFIAGTSIGLYSTTSLDGENTLWTQESPDEIGAVVVDHFASRASDGLIAAGTHGNGIYSATYEVVGLPLVDLFASQIFTPTNGPLGSNEALEIEVGNAGEVAQNQFDILVFSDGQLVATESINEEVMPGEKLTLSLATELDLSVIKDYEISFEVQIEGDANPGNNNFSKVVSNIEAIPLISYSESFEEGEAGWTAAGSWQLGSPNGTNLNQASDGSSAWVTNLNGNYPSSDFAVLASPYYDFTSAAGVTISFDLKYDAESEYDGMVLGYRTDAESNYTIIPSSDATSNWYNENAVASIGGSAWSGFIGDYVRSEASLDFLISESFVQLAFIFVSDGSVEGEGFAIDNISLITDITERDLRVTDITAPSQFVKQAEAIVATIENNGSLDQNDFEVTFTVNDEVFETVLVNEVLRAGESAQVSTSTSFDFSSTGIYTVKVEAVLLDDELSADNIRTEEFYNLPLVGDYQMVQQNVGTGGIAANLTGDGFLFSTTGTNVVRILPGETESQRTMILGYLSYTGLESEKVFTFSLEGTSVIFDDNQNSNYLCEAEEVILGTSTVSGSYNTTDDGQFTLQIKENSTLLCGATAQDILFMMTKLTPVNAADQAVLESFYQSTGGTGWRTSWDLSKSPYEWLGVTINESGRVSELDLNDNNLTGNLPAVIGDLDALTSLNLGFNSLGGVIPAELGKLDGLTVLGLPSNQLEGEIPVEFGQLTALERLGLRSNFLTGSLPDGVRNFSNLQVLSLHQNSLSSIPDLSGLSSITNFQVQDNALTFQSIVPNSAVLTRYSPQALLGDPVSEVIVEGDSYSMEVLDVTDGNVYQWFLDGESIAGASSASYEITSFSELDEGLYTCELTNPAAPDLTLLTSTISLTFTEALGVKEKNILRVYPNPALSNVTVFIDSDERKGEWYILDMSGKKMEVLLVNRKSASEFELDVSNLRAGIYQFILESDQQIYRQQIIKK